MKHITLFLSSIIFVLTACSQSNIEIQPEGELIFQSGFEPDSKIVARGSEADIEGIDKSFSSASDWVNDLDNHPDVGNFNLQYQGGDDSQRYARIIEEPGNPINHVLQFWLNEPNVEGKREGFKPISMEIRSVGKSFISRYGFFCLRILIPFEFIRRK